MSEPTIEVPLSMLQHYSVPGFGESNMDLLETAKRDLVNAGVLLVKLRACDLDHDEACLEGMASTLITRSIERIGMCHNELDCEREDAESAA